MKMPPKNLVNREVESRVEEILLGQAIIAHSDGDYKEHLHARIKVVCLPITNSAPQCKGSYRAIIYSSWHYGLQKFALSSYESFMQF